MSSCKSRIRTRLATWLFLLLKMLEVFHVNTAAQLRLNEAHMAFTGNQSLCVRETGLPVDPNPQRTDGTTGPSGATNYTPPTLRFACGRFRFGRTWFSQCLSRTRTGIAVFTLSRTIAASG